MCLSHKWATSPSTRQTRRPEAMAKTSTAHSLRKCLSHKWTIATSQTRLAEAMAKTSTAHSLQKVRSVYIRMWGACGAGMYAGSATTKL